MFIWILFQIVYFFYKLSIKDQKYSGNDSIYFNSCNYNTFIIKLDEEYVFIETCNNVQWDLDVCNIPDELHIS